MFYVLCIKCCMCCPEAWHITMCYCSLSQSVHDTLHPRNIHTHTLAVYLLRQDFPVGLVLCWVTIGSNTAWCCDGACHSNLNAVMVSSCNKFDQGPPAVPVLELHLLSCMAHCLLPIPGRQRCNGGATVHVHTWRIYAGWCHSRHSFAAPTASLLPQQKKKRLHHKSLHCWICCAVSYLQCFGAHKYKRSSFRCNLNMPLMQKANHTMWQKLLLLTPVLCCTGADARSNQAQRALTLQSTWQATKLMSWTPHLRQFIVRHTIVPKCRICCCWSPILWCLVDVMYLGLANCMFQSKSLACHQLLDNQAPRWLGLVDAYATQEKSAKIAL